MRVYTPSDANWLNSDTSFRVITNGVNNSFVQACSEEQQRYEELPSKDLYPMRDVRLENPVIYYLKNRAPRLIVQRAILEQFAATKVGNISVR